MDNEDIIRKLRFIIYGDNAWRVQARKDKHGKFYVLYDAHGQSVAEAKRNIRNIVNVVMIPIRIKIVHGFHNGTAIKDMLSEMDFGDKIACIYSPKMNKGETILRLS